jgi:hypothetical protein
MPSNPNEKSRAIRGSQKLLAHLAKNDEVPSLEEIKKALALPADVELRVPNWLIRGTPPAYLQLDATFQVPIAQLNEIVHKFANLNDSTINMRILINGTPVPDLATVEVRNTPEEI